MTFHDRTRPIMLDRTQAVSGQSPSTLCVATSVGLDIGLHRSVSFLLSVRSETDVARPLLPLTGRACPTETSVRSLTVTSVFSV